MVAIRGGDKMNAALAEISARIKKASVLQVGFLEGGTYPDGTSVPMVAAIQNFGAPRVGIPPRPYFSSMVAEKQDEWGPALLKLLRANAYDVELSFKTLGEGIRGQLQQSINDWTVPPLAESTVARKGFDKPLIDTSHMINSADYRVK